MGAPGALRLLGLGTRHRHGSCSGTLPQGHLEILEDFGGWTTRTRGKQHLVWVVVSFLFFTFSPGTLGKWSNLTIIFFRWGWNHHLVVDWFHQFFWFPLRVVLVENLELDWFQAFLKKSPGTLGKSSNLTNGQYFSIGLKPATIKSG